MSTHEGAVILARDHGFSYYDALIVAAALEARCDTLLSEDLQDGRVIDGLTIRNPFLGSRP
jgi:predicted nucleic acid-binding protein